MLWVTKYEARLNWYAKCSEYHLWFGNNKFIRIFGSHIWVLCIAKFWECSACKMNAIIRVWNSFLKNGSNTVHEPLNIQSIMWKLTFSCNKHLCVWVVEIIYHPKTWNGVLQDLETPLSRAMFSSGDCNRAEMVAVLICGYANNKTARIVSSKSLSYMGSANDYQSFILMMFTPTFKPTCRFDCNSECPSECCFQVILKCKASILAVMTCILESTLIDRASRWPQSGTLQVQ